MDDARSTWIAVSPTLHDSLVIRLICRTLFGCGKLWSLSVSPFQVACFLISLAFPTD